MPPLLLAMLMRLLLRGGPIILCGRDFWTASGETPDAYMLRGRALRIVSGVAGGETAMAMLVGIALIRAQPRSGVAQIED